MRRRILCSLLATAGFLALAGPASAIKYGERNSLTPQRGLKNRTFTAVGYGLQYILSSNPVNNQQQRSLDRMHSTPYLLQIHTPGFLGDSNVVGGVTSFGINGNCAGTGGVYRMDRAHDIDWVNSFLD